MPHGQMTASHGQVSAPHGQVPVSYGQLSMSHGQASMPDGQLPMSHGRMTTPYGQMAVSHGQVSMPHTPPPPASVRSKRTEDPGSSGLREASVPQRTFHYLNRVKRNA